MCYNGLADGCGIIKQPSKVSIMHPLIFAKEEEVSEYESWMCVKSLQSCLQARILEWVAMPFSRGPSRTRDQTQVSYNGRRVLYH